MNIKLKYEVRAPYAENLIKQRGIADVEHFLHPSEEDLQAPGFLGAIECSKAVEAIENNVGKRAMTIVDSDQDGQCSSAILLSYLKLHYPDWHIDYFIHHGKEHGLEDVVLDPLLDLSDYDLVFLPDAGSNDDIYFNEYSDVQFIILDHHIRSIAALPPSNAIIINNQMAKEYKNKALSGAGVTWQFCRYFDNAKGTDYASRFTDLAAVAIIGDVMDITTPENRYIIHKGIEEITSSIYRNKFIRLLYNNAAFSIGDTLTPIGIAFYIVPMINSMCRTGTYDEKERMFKALITPDEMVECHKRGVEKGTQIAVASESVRECSNAKARQKRAQTQMAELCAQQILENDLTNNKIITLILDENFDSMPSEMNGLTATKIANDYGHPTLIGRIGHDGCLRGSIRGLSTIDMPPFKDFLQSSGMFTMLEGHQLAQGFAIPYNRLSSFISWSNEQLKDVDMDSKTWMVDFKKNADDPTLPSLIQDMAELKSCWGQGFPEALIAVDNICARRSDISVMGKLGDTVKITCNGIAYMFFKRTPEQVEELTQYAAARLKVVGKANLNVYYNRVTPQIFVDDYEIEDDALAF